MSRIIGYCRVSTKTQKLENQEHLILKYCHDNKLFIDEWVRVDISSRAKETDRKITYLIEKLESGDLLIVSEISRLGRSAGSVISFIEKILAIGVRLKDGEIADYQADGKSSPSEIREDGSYTLGNHARFYCHNSFLHG